MSGHPPNVRSTLVLAALALGVFLAPAARADTVYLKSGRAIRAEHVEIVGDRLVMIQGGNRIELPMSVVERIVPDEEGSPGSVLPTPGEARPAPTATPRAGAGAPASAGEGAPGEGAEAEAEGETGDTREAWQARVRAILDEQEQKKLDMESLRREERAFMFSHRSTVETRRRIEAAQARITELDEALTALRREARQKNIPAGWLRVSG